MEATLLAGIQVVVFLPGGGNGGGSDSWGGASGYWGGFGGGWDCTHGGNGGWGGLTGNQGEPIYLSGPGGGSAPGTGSPPVGRPGRPAAGDAGGTTPPVLPTRGGGSINADGIGVPSDDQNDIVNDVQYQKADRALGQLEYQRIHGGGLMNLQWQVYMSLQRLINKYQGSNRPVQIPSAPKVPGF